MQTPPATTLGNLRGNGMQTLTVAFIACLTSLLAQAADFSGVPRIVDGDTLAIGSTKVRLEGIDAPETDQVCLNANLPRPRGPLSAALLMCATVPTCATSSAVAPGPIVSALQPGTELRQPARSPSRRRVLLLKSALPRPAISWPLKWLIAYECP
jgi:hypothetical protein